jgi:glycosyltransferase involved in cell wall biosynthesis
MDFTGEKKVVIVDFDKTSTHVRRQLASHLDGLILSDYFLNTEIVGDISFLNKFSLLLRLLKRLRGDGKGVVHVLSFGGGTNVAVFFALFFIRFKWIPTINGIGRHVDIYHKLSIVGLLYMLIVRYFSFYAFVQNSRDLRLLKKSKSKVVPGSGFNKELLLIDLKEGAGRYKVGFVGRKEELKGYFKFIELANEVDDCDFYIYGEGEDFFKNELNVKNMGYLRPLEIFSFIDILVLPTEYGEGIPRTVIESAAAGCLILSSRIPGNISLVDEYNIEMELVNVPVEGQELKNSLQLITSKSRSENLAIRRRNRLKTLGFDIDSIAKLYSHYLKY